MIIRAKYLIIFFSTIFLTTSVSAFQDTSILERYSDTRYGAGQHLRQPVNDWACIYDKRRVFKHAMATTPSMNLHAFRESVKQIIEEKKIGTVVSDDQDKCYFEVVVYVTEEPGLVDVIWDVLSLFGGDEEIEELVEAMQFEVGFYHHPNLSGVKYICVRAKNAEASGGLPYIKLEDRKAKKQSRKILEQLTGDIIISRS